jgi:hypothetical protein
MFCCFFSYTCDALLNHGMNGIYDIVFLIWCVIILSCCVVLLMGGYYPCFFYLGWYGYEVESTPRCRCGRAGTGGE